MLKKSLDLGGSCGALDFFPSQTRYTPDILIIHTTWWEKLLSSLPEHARGVLGQHTAPVGLDRDGQEGRGIFKRQDINSTFLAPISDNPKSPFTRPVRKRKFCGPPFPLVRSVGVCEL